MAPTAVLIFLPTTPPTQWPAQPTTITITILWTSVAATAVPLWRISAYIGKHRSDWASHQILSLADSPSVSVNDIMAIVAVYFDINSGFAEREAEAVAKSISRSFFVCQTWSALPFPTLPNSLLRLRILITAKRILLILLFVLTFRLTLLIVTLLTNI